MDTAIIGDDHPFIRTIVRHTLEEMGVQVVAEAGDGVQVMQAVRELKPGLLVLDLDMPRINGMGVLERLDGLAGRPRVLVLSGHPPEHFARRCMNAGAHAYLCKKLGLERLGQAVDALRAGFVFFPEHATRSPAAQTELAKESGILAALPPRELQVLRYLAMGLANVTIAEMLGISVKTVSGHKRSLLSRFHVRTSIDLAHIVARHYGV